MIRSLLGVLCACVLLAATTVTRAAADPVAIHPKKAERPAWVERGRESYLSFCATCHGEEGAGSGPLSRWLTVEPPDLTSIASRRGGEFPTDAIHGMIDGTRAVRAHGTSEMPAWGRILTVAEDPNDPDDVERVGRVIREMVLYLESIQEVGVTP